MRELERQHDDKLNIIRSMANPISTNSALKEFVKHPMQLTFIKLLLLISEIFRVTVLIRFDPKTVKHHQENQPLNDVHQHHMHNQQKPILMKNVNRYPKQKSELLNVLSHLSKFNVQIVGY